MSAIRARRSKAEQGRLWAAVEVWVRRGCGLLVAGVAAYASYQHQRGYALTGGADGVSAWLWPLSVDGLLLLATVGLLRTGPHTSRRTLVFTWVGFGGGTAVSLWANIAAAPVLTLHSGLVAGWPPAALLLAVELLINQPAPPEEKTDHAERDSAETVEAASGETSHGVEMEHDNEVITLASAENGSSAARDTPVQVMWAYYERERAKGRTSTGAELDRVAGTSNYGRAVLARWRRSGRIPQLPAPHIGLERATPGNGRSPAGLVPAREQVRRWPPNPRGNRLTCGPLTRRSGTGPMASPISPANSEIELAGSDGQVEAVPRVPAPRDRARTRRRQLRSRRAWA